MGWLQEALPTDTQASYAAFVEQCTGHKIFEDDVDAVGVTVDNEAKSGDATGTTERVFSCAVMIVSVCISVCTCVGYRACGSMSVWQV